MYIFCKQKINAAGQNGLAEKNILIFYRLRSYPFFFPIYWKVNSMKIIIDSTTDFDSWLEGLTLKEELQIRKRLLLIENEGHFGDCKYLDGHLFELRWKNGVRIYFAKQSNKKILLLLGGRKNAQEKEIKKARILLKRLSERRSEKKS